MKKTIVKYINQGLFVKLVLMLMMTLLTQTGCGNSADEPSVDVKVGVQLWSVREPLKEDFEGTLKVIAELGFAGVEFAGEFGPYADNPEGLKAFLDSIGLVTCGAHVGFEQFGPDSFEKTVEFYKTLGAPIVIIPRDNRAWDLEQVDSLVSDLNTLSEKLADYELKLGYHNHHLEFRDYNETSNMWEHMINNTRDDVVMQLDVGWARYAGVDSVKYIQSFPGRLWTTHMKAKLVSSVPQKGPANIDADAFIAEMKTVVKESATLAEQSDQLPLIGRDGFDWTGMFNVAIDNDVHWLVLEQEEYPLGLTPLEALEISKTAADGYLTAAMQD